MRFCLAICIAVTAAAAPTAAIAQEPTREAYVTRLDRSCTKLRELTEPIFLKGEKALEDGHPERAAERFIEGLKLIKQKFGDFGRVDRPAEDERPLRRWLALERRSAALEIEAWKLLGRGLGQRAQRTSRKARDVHKRSHTFVKGFGLRTCA